MHRPAGDAQSQRHVVGGDVELRIERLGTQPRCQPIDQQARVRKQIRPGDHEVFVRLVLGGDTGDPKDEPGERIRPRRIDFGIQLEKFGEMTPNDVCPRELELTMHQGDGRRAIAVSGGHAGASKSSAMRSGCGFEIASIFAAASRKTRTDSIERGVHSKRSRDSRYSIA